MIRVVPRAVASMWRHPLSRQHFWRALQRYIRWQIGSRILGWPVVVPFVDDSVLVAEPGMAGATGNIYCGLHEFADMAFLLHVLRPEDGFVDVGANIGSYCVLGGAVVGCRSVAFEPVPSTYKKLQRNLRINGLSERVKAIRVAAGAGSGSIRFTADRDSMNQVVTGEYPGETLEVPTDSLDNLLEHFDARLWKIDVEGYEEAVLEGAGNVLHRPSLWAVSMEADSASLAAAMGAAGFVRASYDPFRRQLSPAAGSAREGNNLWIRRWDEIAERCRAARSFEVAGVVF